MEKYVLEEMNLHDLRRIGRQIGVKAPSGLQKKDLIDAIIRVDKGIDNPVFSKKGRPSLDGFKEIKVRNVEAQEVMVMEKIKLLNDIKGKVKELKKLVDEFLK